MPTKLLTALLLLLSLNSMAQRPGTALPPAKRPASIILNNPQTLAEDCSNGRDDDGNGLVDCEDYSCYFQKPASTCNCVPSNTLWTANAAGELYWANTQTGVETRVGAMGQVMTDLTWTPDGKLYGLDFNGNIYEISPATAIPTYRFTVPGFNAANAMTADMEGNLYVAGQTTLVQYSPQLNRVTMTLNLPPTAVSGGDLAFSGGFLYLACSNNNIAKIDVVNQKVDVLPITGLPPFAAIFGIVSSADGSLYLSGSIEIFKLNPTTMQASNYFQFKTTNQAMWGLANYNDNCNAPDPVCDAAVDIAVDNGGPYCSDVGVKLTATGTGITGSTTFQWQTPESVVANAATVVAKKTGWYKVLYAGPLPFCNDEDSVYITVLPKPAVNLGNDTVMCVGTQFTIRNTLHDPQFVNLWHDGSGGETFTIVRDGKYWLQASNACGTAADTIYVTSLKVPEVDLGEDRELCAYDTLHLTNRLHLENYQYTWSTGATTPQVVAEQAGSYSVQVTNKCGTVTDEIVVNPKTAGCECFLYVPNAFTPNRDGKNDLFKVSATCTITGELTIFNRWGVPVFTTKDLSKGWNGFYKGQLQGTDTYIYIVSYKFLNRPQTYTQKGTLHLID